VPANRRLLGGVVLAGALWTAWLAVQASRPGEAIDLVVAFGQAAKRPHAGLFSTTDATLAGETRPAVAVEPAAATEVRYRLRVPERARLSVAVGLRPEAWTEEGDGVLFRVTIASAGREQALFTQHVNPFGEPDDRKWIPVLVDLSEYGGQDAEVAFATRCGKTMDGDDRRGDLALWGRPRILVR
jgi:hypothetical protein